MNSAITQSGVNIFNDISHADKGTINIKHIKRHQISTFSEYGHVAYQSKGNDACSNMVVW